VTDGMRDTCISWFISPYGEHLSEEVR